MTVKELIEKLQTVPEDYRVLVSIGLDMIPARSIVVDERYGRKDVTIV